MTENSQRVWLDLHDKRKYFSNWTWLNLTAFLCTFFSQQQMRNIMATLKYITFWEQEEQKFRYNISLAQKWSFDFTYTCKFNMCLFLLPTRKPKRLQWPCQILKRFQSMNWTHLNLSSEEGRRSQRHVFLLTFSIYSSFCPVLHVLMNFGFWLFIDFW